MYIKAPSCYSLTEDLKVKSFLNAILITFSTFALIHSNLQNKKLNIESFNTQLIKLLKRIGNNLNSYTI